MEQKVFSSALTERPHARRSSRLAELARRHSLSLSFIYKEIAAGHLRVHKAGAATIVTDDDEQAWLDQMPVLGASTSEDAM
jgi:hypothetical protein